MGDEVVINASPLIFLTRGHHAELLSHFAERILVPASVASELRAKTDDNVTVGFLDSQDWITVIEDPDIPEQILYWGLGPGESAVLAVALAEKGREAIIDDLAGRKCADFLGVPVRGTLGIVLVAKERGLIPQARPVMEALIAGGMYLSRTVLDEALKRVDE